MKLSEAIRKGAAVVPHQARFYPITVEHSLVSDKLAACAIGAAAVGLDPKIARLKERAAQARAHEVLKKSGLTDGLAGKYAIHPETEANVSIWGIITSLNDHHGWNRERIADWLAGQGL